MSEEKDYEVLRRSIAEAANHKAVEAAAAVSKEEWYRMVNAFSNNKVDNPSHYTKGGIECIDYLEAKLTPEQFSGLCIGSAIQYLTRFNHKGDPVGDLKKAVWYVNREINRRSRLSAFVNPYQTSFNPNQGEVK